MTFQPHRPRSKLPAILVVLALLLALVAAAGYLLRPRLESQPPRIQVAPEGDALGLSAPVEILVTDAGTGLKSVTATLSAGGTERTLAAEHYATPLPEKRIVLDLAKVGGLAEGPAVLRVSARDGSLWNSFGGNEAAVQKEFTIDLTPPTVELVADDRYVNFGGVGAIVYKVSADTATSGVRIGERFFPGFPGQVQGRPDHLFALFAHPYDAPAEARAVLVATDRAGNRREMPLAYELMNVRYKKSDIAISERFVRSKVAPLLADAAAREGAVKDVFVAVNNGLRQENERRIAEVTAKATPSMLWKGAFTQLANSKVEANFADLRTYIHDKQPIDTAYHLGYDLSVTRHYPVGAANSGTVAFTGDLGIYGNTVILDHGLGLFTLYSHLSAIDVKDGQKIEARQLIGKTGETGLAAGDHLHYGVYLHGVAVLPLEWWDAKWIADNIQPKLDGRSGAEIAESQQPRRAGGARRR